MLLKDFFLETHSCQSHFNFGDVLSFVDVTASGTPSEKRNCNLKNYISYLKQLPIMSKEVMRLFF